MRRRWNPEKFQPSSRSERLIAMQRLIALAVATLIVVPAYAQEPDARQIAQERKDAEYDAPHLTEVLGLKPGMTVADIGTGGGAMTVVLGKWLGSGHVYATDITERALRITREYAKKEGLTNVTVLEGAADRTNLPAACCDALFLRHVYHHISEIPAFNKSLLASLKPGGRLAIIDFVPPKGSAVPTGVPANREGHGIPPAVLIEELKAAGFTYVRTVDDWPPGRKEAAPPFLALFIKN
jgi:ubiquinone/menaquinone biosynthesis C-methylase UbiE